MELCQTIPGHNEIRDRVQMASWKPGPTVHVGRCTVGPSAYAQYAYAMLLYVRTAAQPFLHVHSMLLISRICAGRVPPSSSGYRHLLTALPGLHTAALQLLQQLLKAGGGTLRPLYASLTRLVADLLRRFAAAGSATFSLSSWLVRAEVTPARGRKSN